MNWTQFFIKCVIQGMAMEIGKNILRNAQKKECKCSKKKKKKKLPKPPIRK